MPPAFDLFAVVVAAMTGGVCVERWRARTPRLELSWQSGLGLLCVVGGQALPAAMRLADAPDSVVSAAGVIRLALIVPGLWLALRYRRLSWREPRRG